MAPGGIIITSDNQGPIINIISWILIVLSFLATSAKVWSKWSLTKRLHADDYYLTAALVSDACTAHHDRSYKLTQPSLRPSGGSSRWRCRWKRDSDSMNRR